MKGYNPFDPFSNNNDIDYVKEMNKDISKMKIAYTTDFGIFEVEESLKNQFLKALDNFKKLDVTIEEVKFNFKHSAMDMANAWCYGITVDCAIELNLAKDKGIDLLNDHKDDFPKNLFIGKINVMNWVLWIYIILI